MSGSLDILTKLRHDDDGQIIEKDTAAQQLSGYLQTYAKDPMTKKELKQHIATNSQLKDQEIHNKTKVVRRMGKDQNDIFYALGKVHGIENIVYLSDEEMSEANTPVLL